MCAVAHTQYSSFGSGYVFCFFKTFLLLLLFNWPCFRLLTLKFLSANMNLEKLSDDLGGAVDCKWSRSPHLIKLRLRNLFIISWNSDFSFDDRNTRRIFPVGTGEFQMIYSKLLSKFYKIIVKKTKNGRHIILWRKDFHIEIWRWRLWARHGVIGTRRNSRTLIGFSIGLVPVFESFEAQLYSASLCCIRWKFREIKEPVRQNKSTWEWQLWNARVYYWSGLGRNRVCCLVHVTNPRFFFSWKPGLSGSNWKCLVWLSLRQPVRGFHVSVKMVFFLQATSFPLDRAIQSSQNSSV